jgi:pimeloyl-ACP methyl ester carboxylesterase
MPAVLVHGVPDTHRLWDRMRTHLKRRDVIAVSLPGFDAPVTHFGGRKRRRG